MGVTESYRLFSYEPQKKKKKKKDCLVTESYRLTRNLFGSIVIAERACICLLRHFLFLLGHLLHIAGIAC